MRDPRVSVIMAVYNADQYVREAVESILTQTYTDFEFLIVNDGSTDKTLSILRSFRDPRIRVINNPQNLGLTRALNAALKLARGEYIARMDADDVSVRDRFEGQVNFMDEHSDVALLGTSWYLIDRDGKEVGVVAAPSGRQAVHFMCHGSVFIRKRSLDKVGFYRELFEQSQDYDLWLRIANEYEVANLKEPLYKLRVHHESVSSKVSLKQWLYGSLALDMAEERRKRGTDTLAELSWRDAVKTRDRRLAVSGIERRKVLSRFYSIRSQDCIDLREYGAAYGYATRALDLYILNLRGWNTLIKAAVRPSTGPFYAFSLVGRFLLKHILKTVRLVLPHRNFMYPIFFVIFRELRDDEWSAIEALFSSQIDTNQRQNRRIVNGILYVLYSGSSWSEMPNRYGNCTIALNRLRQWREDGTWEKISSLLNRTRGLILAPELLLSDSTADLNAVHATAG